MTTRTIKRTADNYFIKYVLNLDDMYTQLAYDNSPTLDQFVPEGLWFLLLDGSDIAGMINVLPMNNVMWNCHVFIFEQYRGNGTEEWGIQVADYMRRNCAATKFIAITPYESAKKYAERMGMNNVTILKKSIRKNNQLLDQYMLEMN